MAESYPDVKILLVDTSPGMRGILSAVLRGLGFPSIHSANDTDHAKRMMQMVKPDLLILDLRPPLWKGLRFVRELRFDVDNPYSTVPIIVATGHTEEKHVRACVAAGVDQFLAKPISGQAMADRITQVILGDRVFVRTTNYAGPQRAERV